MTKSTITREESVQAVFDLKAGYRLGFADIEILKRVARMALAAMEGESHTDDELSNLLWYSQEATCHYDPNYSCEFQRLATPGLVAGIILELQERRKAAIDGEPVAEVLSNRPGNDTSTIDRALPVGTQLYLHAQPAVDSDFIPKNLDKALGVVGVAIPESREEFNLQAERWIQRLIDRVIRYADELQEQPALVVPEEITSAIEGLKQLLVDCNRYNYCFDAVTRVENACRAAMLAAAQQEGK